MLMLGASVEAFVVTPVAHGCSSRASRPQIVMEFGKGVCTMLPICPMLLCADVGCGTALALLTGFGSYYSGWEDWVKEYPVRSQCSNSVLPCIATGSDGASLVHNMYNMLAARVRARAPHAPREQSALVCGNWPVASLASVPIRALPRWQAEDREAYPALFALPDGCYEIVLEKPLGIAFIEGDKGGVEVDYLVDGGSAERSGLIKPGDVLLATTACMGRDGTFERKVIPSRYLDFDTIMAAIGSNAPKFHKKRKNDVILQFARPDAPYENDGDPYDGGKRGITDYLDSLKFPSDSPWLAR